MCLLQTRQCPLLLPCHTPAGQCQNHPRELQQHFLCNCHFSIIKSDHSFGLCCQEMVIAVNLFLLLLELPFLWMCLCTLALCAPAEIKNWVPCCYQAMQGDFSRVSGIRLMIYFHYKNNLQFIHTEHPDNLKRLSFKLQL